MRVEFLDLLATQRELNTEINDAIQMVVSGARYALGPAVVEFEQAFGDYVGAYHCIGLNSGTSALHLALIAADVGPGDEVITTPMTWISTAWAISYVGATPVFVDVDPHTYNLDAAKVEAAITPRTKVILPVHLYGQAAEIEELAIIARRHNLLMIEDAAQAQGARRDGKHVGTTGKMGCFSFYPAKNLGAYGEAGAVVTDDARIAERIRALRDHAQQGRHNHTELGFNARMDSIQAAVLTVKLRKLDEWNARRRKFAAAYVQQLTSVSELKLPFADRRNEHNWHLYVVLCEVNDRERLRQHLIDHEIGAAVHYPTLVPFQPAYEHLGYQRGQLPVAEHVADTCLSLPMHPHLTQDQIDLVCRELKAAISPATPAG